MTRLAKLSSTVTLVVLVWLLSEALIAALAPRFDTAAVYSRKMKFRIAGEANRYDFVALGSSFTYNAVLPKLIEKLDKFIARAKRLGLDPLVYEVGEVQDHVPARRRAAAFDEAEMLLGDLGLEGKIELAEPAKLAPVADEMPDRGLLVLVHVRQASAGRAGFQLPPA